MTSWDDLRSELITPEDEADVKQRAQLLRELVAYRLQVIAEVTTMLRAAPRYDRDYAALLRAARRIEEWASP